MDVLSRSLEEIEGEFWGDAPSGSSRLVSTAHELRRRPVGELEVEDLRLLLGQTVGVETLVPVALSLLEADPLAEGDFYPGDLLVAVLGLPVSYWAAHSAEAARLRAVVDGMEPDQVDDQLGWDIAAFRGHGY